MSEPISATIFIGGKFPRAKLSELLAASMADGACKDYDEDYPEEVAALLDCVDDDGHLHLCNNEANYGTFEALESFCRDNRLSYDRYSDAKYDYDGIVEYFRPGGRIDRVHIAHVSQSHQLLVSAEELASVVQAAKDAKGSSKVILQTLLCSLDELLDRPPSLPKFEVIESVPQKRARRNPTRKRR